MPLQALEARWEFMVFLNWTVFVRLETTNGKSKRRARQFLRKEIKTYMALALFLSKKDKADRVRLGRKEVVISPAFYQGRMKEARKLVNELSDTK